MDIKQKTQEIETELLELITQHLQQNSIQADKASKLARDFLAVLPMESQEDLLNKLKNLSTQYGEAKILYLNELKNEIQNKEQHALHQMQGAIRSGNIEHAISIAKSLQAQ